MANERFPADQKIGLDDFNTSGWRQAIETEGHEGYASMWHAFSVAAKVSIEENRSNHAKVLWLLADACSMMLSPESLNKSFKSIPSINGKRSALPDDFDESVVTFFSSIVDSIDNIRLKARINDILWILKMPRDRRYALAAIDAYKDMALDEETWIRDGRECWERALSLTRMIGRGAGSRESEMESKILTAFDATTRDNGFLSLWLAELMLGNGIGRGSSARIATKLEHLAAEFLDPGDLHHAKSYFSIASKWYSVAKDELKSFEMISLQAECFKKEAISRISSPNPSHAAASSFYENAIQLYRSIPLKYRPHFTIDEKLRDLYKDLAESGKRSLDEMGMIRTDGVDISEIAISSRNAVQGKSPLDALKSFANISPNPVAKNLREQALEQLRNHPLHGLFPATVMSHDGRVIAKRPGLSLNGTNPEGDEITIRSEMIRNYSMHISLIVSGSIIPALNVLHIEHRIREIDFISIAKESPIVPVGREVLYGKGLFAGYDHDFATSLHLLSPQIEHMIRVHLKQVGAKTTTISQDGIENEIGLSNLVDMPEVATIFGEAFTFEVKTLFCDPFGPNLRNELAHGLVEYDECNSYVSVYAWWLCLKIAFNVWWNAMHKPAQEPNAETTNH